MEYYEDFKEIVEKTDFNILKNVKRDLLIKLKIINKIMYKKGGVKNE